MGSQIIYDSFVNIVVFTDYEPHLEIPLNNFNIFYPFLANKKRKLDFQIFYKFCTDQYKGHILPTGMQSVVGKIWIDAGKHHSVPTIWEKKLRKMHCRTTLDNYGWRLLGPVYQTFNQLLLIRDSNIFRISHINNIYHWYCLKLHLVVASYFFSNEI